MAEAEEQERGRGAPASPDVAQPRLPGRLGRLALTYGIAAVAGAVAVWLGIPLPWMLGPFFVFAALSVSGLAFELLPMGREIGQVAIGTAVGLRFTGDVLLAVVTLLPAMLLATAYVMAFTMLAAFLIRPMARMDSNTAFFATAAGGMADMAHVAERHGGSPGSVAVVHSMRVSLVVAVVPFLVHFFGERGTALTGQGHSPDNLLLVALALAAGLLAARLLKGSPLPNRWLVGPILAGMVLGISGLVQVTIPGLLILLAQIALGTWLGCRFRREMLAALPRVTASAVAVAVFMILCAAAGALVLSGATGLPYTTSFLALAPAAVTEMVLTAQVMNLDAEVVSAFHVMRIAVVSSTILLMFRVYKKFREATVGSGA
jgi:uncharacterized protein